MKKIILLMLFAALGWQQADAQVFGYNGLTFTVTAPGQVALTGLDEDYDLDFYGAELEIPQQVVYSYEVLEYESWYSYNYYCNCYERRPIYRHYEIYYTVTSVGDWALDYTNFQTVVLPNTIITIGAGAFNGCSNLTSFTIPNSVSSIGDNAFYGCSNLTSVTCNLTNPLSINANVFQGFNQGACSLTVPDGSVAAYQMTSVWGNFAPIRCVNSTENTTIISACGSYTWANNGQTYITSGIKTGLNTNCITQKLDLTITTAPAAPTASAQTFCSAATVQNLSATGTALQWYDVATLGTALAPTSPLTSGTYYVSQTLNSCESSRTAVAVTVGCDTTAPTLVISSTANNPTNLASIPLTFTFSEAVTGFTVSDIFALGGTLNSFSGSGTIYTANLIPSGEGIISLFVFQDLCTDLAGNGNLFSSFNVISDRRGPIPIISSTIASPTSNTIIPIAINFTEAVTGFDITDLTLSGGGTFSNFAGSGANYTVNLNPVGTGTKRINVGCCLATDLAGNINPGSPQFSISYVAPCSQTTTWNGLFWTNGEPVAAQPAVITANLVATSNIAACSLIIGNGAAVTVPSGYKFTISGSVNVQNDSSLIFENNAYLIQSGTTNVNVGNITIKRDSNALKLFDYTLWSSPVSGQQLQGFSTATLSNRFYTYNSGIDKYSAANATANFAPATGYLIRMPNNHPIVPTVWNGSFTGKPNNGTITLSDLASEKYYAIGNPYPSTISADAFLDGNATDGTLYFWRKTNGVLGTAYATYTRAGGAGTDARNGGVGAPNGTIHVGQGFIVQTGTAATSLTFTNAMRTTESGSQFFKSKAATDKSRVWLSLSDAKGSLNQTMIAYMAGATIGVDAGYDGKYINDSKIALTSSIDGQEYIIQARPTFDATDVVALNFKTDVAGDYSIALDSFDGLFENGFDVYLVDAVTGKETNLKSTAYSFTAAAGVDNTRFTLKYQKTLKIEAPEFNENSVTVFRNNGVVTVNSTSKAIKTVQVYDVQGRLIAQQKNVNAAQASFNNLKTASQVLIVKVIADDNTEVSKKVLN